MSDKFGVIDIMINKINSLADANGITRCVLLVELIQMLSTLKNGLKDEDNAHEQRISILESQLEQLTTPPTPEPGGEVLGGEIYTFGLSEGDENATNPDE